MRCFLAILLAPFAVMGFCDMSGPPTSSQVPSHQAEFMMSTEDYPELMNALDGVTASFRLKRFGAATGLDELKGREVLFALYGTDIGELQAALDVTDVKDPGKVLLSVYADYFDEPEQRRRFVSNIAAITHRFGGTLAPIPE